MSEMAKSARAALKAKAQRLGSDRPLTRVDSSTFTPPEMLNADVKTGLRPISKRQFKKGGKVTGAATVARADRKARKSGGKVEYKAEATEFANAKVNRNVKDANQLREGKKHIGGMKKGGRAMKAEGGVPLPPPRPKNLDAAPAKPADKKMVEPGDAASRDLNRMMEIQRREDAMAPRKSGGRAKKNEGGPMAGAAKMMDKASKTAGVPSGGIYGAGFERTGAGSMSPAGALGKQKMKKGGMAHPDEAMDKALIKKMVKPEARKGKAIGGVLGQALSPALMLANAIRGNDKNRGGSAKHPDEKMDKALIKKMVKPSARAARKDGGKVSKTGKGKTDINIIIAAGGKDQKPGLAPDMSGAPMGGMPVPVPPPQAGTPMGGMPQGAPMPMPAPGGAPGGLPPGMPPMGRKTGGRVSKIASSYKDMTAGAGSGEGRLQKTDIAKRQPKPGFQRGDNFFEGEGYPNKVQGAIGGRTAKQKGGKVYKSYKDMDAGAGSGRGRLEKTEIQARKG